MARTRRLVLIFVCALLVVASRARADELWIAPTSQSDLGGFGVASNLVWPATPIGAVRLAWGVPNDLQTFQTAKVVLIPHAPGAGTLNVIICAAQNGTPATGSCAGPFAQPFTAVTNQLQEIDISTIVGPQVGTAGLNNLAILAYTTPTTLTDHIVGMRFAYDRTPPGNVATLGANTFTGTQTAPAFVGNGSGLTNLPVPSGVATLGLNTFTGVQTAPAFVGDGSGLTNLPAPSNVATLGPNTFTGTQTINAGNLDLDPSTSATGLITKNGTRFLHNAGSFNVFLGESAGNFTLTGCCNTGVGGEALSAVTTGGGNTAHGAAALQRNTIGSQNTATGINVLSNNTSGGNNAATGANALLGNTTGSHNSAHGTLSMQSNTTGFGNTALGSFAINNNTTGNYNVAVGIFAGSNLGSSGTAGSNNIYLGANVFGVAGESNAMYFGNQDATLGATITKAVIAGVRGTAVTGGEMVLIDANGRLGSASVTVGSAQVIDNSLTADDLAPSSVGPSELAADAVDASKVAFNYAGSASEGGPASNLACAGCVDASEVSFSYATLGANTFTGTQTINSGNLDLDNSTATTGLLTKNGQPFLHDYGFANIFLGPGAGNFTMTGDRNTAIGDQSFRDNTTGRFNTTYGEESLFRNTTGNFNTAIGASALANNHVGANNVAVGALAGFLSSGSNNIYLGANIIGADGESNTIAIGVQGQQTRTMIAGIRNITTGVPNAIPVVIDSNGQLGTVSSSIRFKEDIHDMADASAGLFKLHPVTFRYTQAYGNGTKPIQFGLIAEEVAEVFPELAVRGADGEVETVHYETLNVLLLNEVQKQQRRLEDQQQALQEARRTMERQASQLISQQERIDALGRQVEQLLNLISTRNDE